MGFDIRRGTVVEYVDSESDKDEHGRYYTKRVSKYGVWDGEKVILNDESKTTVRKQEWLTPIKREPGYYWVQLHPGKWEVMKLGAHGEWYLFNTNLMKPYSEDDRRETILLDSELVEICGIPIIPLQQMMVTETIVIYSICSRTQCALDVPLHPLFPR